MNKSYNYKSPEYKIPQEKTYKQGIKLTTVKTIRGPENV